MRSSPLNTIHVTLTACLLAAGCSGGGDLGTPLNPDTAPVAQVDRFQDSFAALFKRSGPAFDPTTFSQFIPPAGAPINLDNFIEQGLGPAGEKVTYYTLDAASNRPSKAYQFVGADGAPVQGQLPVVDTLPGDSGYSDFVLITTVRVGSGYVANTLTSADKVQSAISSGSVSMTATTQINNWPRVPQGTTATRKFQGQTVTGFRAWYKDQVASYLQFETGVQARPDGTVPMPPIIVIFKNDATPAEGFATEPGTQQTHNVLGSLPGRPGYTSLWDHSLGNLSGFNSVTNMQTAMANIKMKLNLTVNCPVVTP